MVLPGLADSAVDYLSTVFRCSGPAPRVEVPPLLPGLHVVCASCGIVDHRSPDGKICAHCGYDLAVYLNRHDLRDMLEAGLVRTKESLQ